MSKRTITIDGLKCISKESVAAEISAQLKLSRAWNGNLDALNDMLYGSFGAPEGAFVLEWTETRRAEKQLGPFFRQIISVIQTHQRIELRLR